MKRLTVHIVSAMLGVSLISASMLGQKPSSGASKASTPAHSAAKQPTTEELQGFMKHMFGYDPTVKWKIESVKPSEVPGVTEVVVAFGDPVQQRTPFYVAGDSQHAFIGQIIPFGADPFGPVRRKLVEEAKGPVKGEATAPVEIVEFSDFECPHCKHAMPVIDKLMSESPNAKLVFENFPLSTIHKWADLAAGYADCIARKSPDQFWKFAQAVFDQQEQITDETAAGKLSAIAESVGADPPATAACAASSETKARVNQQYELGASLGVTGTPTIFLNGRKIENVSGTPYEVLRQMVEFEAGQSANK